MRSNSIGMEQLPHHVIEEILQRVDDVQYLLRCRPVSKAWNSLIRSTSFASRFLTRAQTRNPQVLLGSSVYQKFDDDADDDTETYTYLRKMDFEHTNLENFPFFSEHDGSRSITGSCDGLVCVYDFRQDLYVINPETRWSRSLPRSMIQQQVNGKRLLEWTTQYLLGFGKDTRTGEYKLVWLYNSLDLSLDAPTTCEVFEFTTNTWKHVSGSPHQICDGNLSCGPVYLDGSLYWFTEQLDGETKIISFDMHTEGFQVMPETPIVHASPRDIIMCSLNNRLCVSEKKIHSQDIWSLNSHKIWEKTYTINMDIASNTRMHNTFPYVDEPTLPIAPVTILDKTKLLLHYRREGSSLLGQGLETGFKCDPCFLIQDTKERCYRFLLGGDDLDRAVSYIPSFLSI